MSNKVKEFLNERFGEVRVEKDGSKLWFCAGDIAKVFNYNATQKITDKVDDEDRDYRKWVTLGGEQEMVCINESGLYQVVFSITKKDKERYDKVKDFKKWVTEVVIPAIRKDDGYISGEEDFAKGDMSEDELILKAMTVMQDKITRLKEENEKMKPKVIKWDQFLDSNGCYSFTEVSKLISTMANKEETELTLSAIKLTDFLREEGVLSKAKTPDKENKKGSYKNLPNKDYEGYFNVVSVNTNGGFNKTQTKVKASGVEYIYDLLKEKYKKAE